MGLQTKQSAFFSYYFEKKSLLYTSVFGYLTEDLAKVTPLTVFSRVQVEFLVEGICFV